MKETVLENALESGLCWCANWEDQTFCTIFQLKFLEGMREGAKSAPR